MPKTRKERIIFTLIVASLMCYIMTVYNLSLSNNRLTYNILFTSLKEFYKELIIAYPLAYFVATPIAKKQTFKLTNKEKDNPLLITLLIQTFTVLIMVSLMTLFILIINNQINKDILCTYILNYINNFKLAYPIQILLVGPISRYILKKI